MRGHIFPWKNEKYLRVIIICLCYKYFYCRSQSFYKKDRRRLGTMGMVQFLRKKSAAEERQRENITSFSGISPGIWGR